ncbi:hypothetical protein HB364_23835 [Pseudoflavitalea sp. X16]|uniref:M56 family metallopeptidase n=1 Tax=Paraflavitalea devenefica TaxID=2716334 RepID=UPI00141FEC76|nr:M56 family metallopeptidase [Paraflavitalea devenefica]NII28135.1 hypothetical protein [Paraflavitalea devenefica]
MIFITYLGKMVLCSGILFGYYWLFLRNRRFHHYNRFYLLGALALSIVLPLFKIPVFNEDTGVLNQVVYQTARVITLQPLTHQPAVPAQQTTSLFTFTNLIWVLYSAGILVLLATLGRSLWYIRRLSHQYPYEMVERLKFYRTREPGTPFSFFRSIFWNAELNLNSREGQQVFRHELFHVEQKHSADILLAEVITIMGWFNPFFYLIKKELKAIHEFLADQYAASGSNRYQYAELLVQQVMNARHYLITHHFFQNQLKRRIAMITQLNQSKYGYWSRVMVLPVSVILFLSVTLYAADNKNKQHLQQEKMYAQANTGNELPIIDTIPARKLQTEEQLRKEAELKVLREKQFADEQQFRYEKEYKGKELKLIQEKQQVLEKMLREQVKTEQEIIIKKEIRELKQQELALQEITINHNNNGNQHFNYDERTKLEKEKNDLLTMRKDVEQHKDGPKDQLLAQIDLKLKALEEVRQQELKEIRQDELKEKRLHELAVQQHFNYAEDSTQITLHRFFNRNFRYPLELMDHDGTGSVWYSFLLDEGGNLRDYEVYNEQPAAAKGVVQEIVIVGFRDASKQPGNSLGTERNQQLLKAEVSRVLAKGVNLFKGRKVTPARYYYKATFKLEK